MTLGAIYVEARHGKSARRFHDVHAMRVVALDAVHFAFDDGMMLREVEFGMCFQVALKTGGGVLAGIDDELAASAARHDVFAGGAVAGFATPLAGEPGLFGGQSRVGAGPGSAAGV